MVEPIAYGDDPGDTIALAADGAVAEPERLEAVTATLSVAPMSACASIA
jgi:hypothetical protein